MRPQSLLVEPSSESNHGRIRAQVGRKLEDTRELVDDVVKRGIVRYFPVTVGLGARCGDESFGLETKNIRSTVLS